MTWLRQSQRCTESTRESSGAGSTFGRRFLLSLLIFGLLFIVRIGLSGQIGHNGAY